MAEGNMVNFGYLKINEIQQAIDEGHISSWSVIFTSDTNQIYLIDDENKPIQIKSRIPVYISESMALESIKKDKSIYPGEIIAIYVDNDHFESYIVNQFPNGDFYIKPVVDKNDFDYDKIANIPIINLSSDILNPVDIKELSDGIYKINYFISPTGAKINSLVGNIFVVESDLKEKRIKRIAQDNIIDYTIDLSTKEVITHKYITDTFLTENNYMTSKDVDKKLAALDIITTDQLSEYVKNYVAEIVKECVTQELDARYADNEDITNLFE